MAKLWTLTFSLQEDTPHPRDMSHSKAREIIELMGELEPPPKRVEFLEGNRVETDFVVEADDQLNAVKSQNKIDKKLRDAIEGLLGVDVTFSNPIPMQ